MARSISVVVTGNSIGSAAMPINPLTPPLMPANSVAARCAGGRFDCGSMERMAILSAVEDGDFSDLVDAVGRRIRHQPHRPRRSGAGIVGEPSGEVLIFQIRGRRGAAPFGAVAGG